uniref:Ig-like domain-containing protein n=1 Tax=Gopherus agassizii TaxID=38772 RepID=A0A452HWE6_9SAUR
QKSFLWTVALMVFAWVEHVIAKKDGLDQPAIKEPITLAVLNMEPVNVARGGMNVTLKCMIEISGTIIQISWEKIHGKSKQTIAVLHPEEGFAPQGEYQGRVSLKNNSLTDATIILHNISFSDSGEYVCKAVTFPLGNTESSTTVTVLGMFAS